MTVEASGLTEREVAVLRLRAAGEDHAAIADALPDRLDAEAPDLTPMDIREIERDAERTIERARKTLDLAASIRRAPVTFSVDPETTIEDLAREVYDRGDDAAIDVTYCHADLQAHLRTVLGDRLADDRLAATARLTLTEDGDVTVDRPADEPMAATDRDRS